ncbi:MAG: lactonase family protein [Algoriphagus sp.]|uniref:lactonase family protein n=1 Tax=Algoriphagus sp. TaxID=1872435 RepID=UPI0017FCC9D6|nr:lactonase family protein [Algoriphagus sp.]NVJ85265.1 lactonase family protein [Algoriphagus sp.]
MKKLSFLLISLLTFACQPKTSESIKSMNYEFLIGSYTDSPEEGISLLTFSPSNHSLSISTIAPEIINPSFVLADEERVFAVEETEGPKGGQILSFQWDETHQSLQKVDEKNTEGNHPCHIAYRDGFLVVSNYSGGNFSILKVREDGSLTPVQLIQHSGSSINAARQEAAHVHSANFSPDGKFLLVADLGTDRIYSYEFNKENPEPAQLLEEIPMTPGDGPRHLSFSPSGNEVFVVQELTAVLEVFDYKDGKLQSKQRLSLISEGFEGAVGAAEVRVSSDGNFIYASNRGDANTISVFSKQEDGSYSLVEHVPSGGIMPRNFILTADGKYVLVAHQASENIVVFERDQESGKLKPISLEVTVPKPVYLFDISKY